MSRQEADLLDPTVLSAVSVFREMTRAQQEAVFREQYETIASPTGGAWYSAVPKTAVAHLRDLVNLAVSRPAMDKLRPGITGMDAKYILCEMLPLLLPLYNGTLVDATLTARDQARAVLERAAEPGPDVDSMESLADFYYGCITSALAIIGDEP